MFFFIVLLIFFFNNELALGKLNEVHIFSLIEKLLINNLKSYIYHWHPSISGCFFQSDCLAGFYCNSANSAFNCEPGCVTGSICPVGHFCDLSSGSPGTCTGIKNIWTSCTWVKRNWTNCLKWSSKHHSMLEPLRKSVLSLSFFYGFYIFNYVFVI